MQDLIFREVKQSFGDLVREKKQFFEFPLVFHQSLDTSQFVVGRY